MELKDTIDNILKHYEIGLSHVGITYSYFDREGDRGFHINYKDISGNIFISNDDSELNLTSLIPYSDSRGNTRMFILENRIVTVDGSDLQLEIFNLINKMVDFKNNITVCNNSLMDIIETLTSIGMDFQTFIRMNDKATTPDLYWVSYNS